MPGGAVIDAALSYLPRALNGDAMLPELARIAAFPAVTCSARILSHKPGQRCTLAYTLTGSDGARVELVGKLYRRRRLAERVYAWTAELAARRASDGPAVPEPLAPLPELGLVLHTRVPASDVRHALAAGSARKALAQAAAWAADLHASAPLDGLRSKPLAHELAKAEAWCERVLVALPEAAGDVRRARLRIAAAARTLGRRPDALVHRDLYYAHVLWDGTRAWILDLDALALGDSALDVGHFLAHLDVLALRAVGDASAYAADGDAFRAAYEAEGGAVDDQAVSLYRGWTLLKIAATGVERRERGWVDEARALVALAGEARGQVGVLPATRLRLRVARTA